MSDQMSNEPLTLQARKDGTVRTITIGIDAEDGPEPRLLRMLANVTIALVLDASANPNGVVRLIGDVRTNASMGRVEIVAYLPVGKTAAQVHAEVEAAICAEVVEHG